MKKNWQFFHVILLGTLFLSTIFISGCNLPGAGSGGAGPDVWIDRPLEGDEFLPMQSLNILAHASDADGIVRFEFFNTDSLLGVVPAKGGRLGEASLEWQPPEPGTYTLSVRAEDSAGNMGTKANVVIKVTGEDNKPVKVTDTATPAPSFGDCSTEALTAPKLLSPANGSTVKSPPVFSWSYPDTTCHPTSYTVEISTDTSFSDTSLGFGTENYGETSREWPLPPGQCYYWRVKAYVPDTNGPASPVWKLCVGDTVTITPSSPTFIFDSNANCRQGPGTMYEAVDAFEKGTKVTVEGRNETGTWFWVMKPQSSKHCWVSTSVGSASGSWQALPVISAPPPQATDTPMPADVTPPDISDLSINPTLISAQYQCGTTPAIATVTVRVADSSGIQRVIARVSGMGEFDMTSTDGSVYQVNIGPFNNADTYSIFIQVTDNAGNTATGGPLNLQVVACPG